MNYLIILENMKNPQTMPENNRTLSHVRRYFHLTETFHLNESNQGALQNYQKELHSSHRKSKLRSSHDETMIVFEG